MTDHKCFEELVQETGSDATFEKSIGINFSSGEVFSHWIIILYHYTPGLRISTDRGHLVLNFCPICGEDLRDELPKCFTCDGLGNILVLNEHGFPEDTTQCPDCNGTGYQQPEETELGG